MLQVGKSDCVGIQIYGYVGLLTVCVCVCGLYVCMYVCGLYVCMYVGNGKESAHFLVDCVSGDVTSQRPL